MSTSDPNGAATADQAGWSGRERLSLALFIVAVIIFRLYNLRAYDVISADGTSYGQIGVQFFFTGDFRVFGTISGPVYSFLVGLCNLLVHDIELSLRLVSVLTSSLTVAVVYCLARSFYGRTAAIAAGLLCATLPSLHGMSGFDIIEPTFTLFLLAGSWYLWQGYATGRTGSAVAGGLLLAVSYLSRSEGFISWFALSVFFGGDALLRWRSDGRRLLGRVLLPSWLAFMLLFTPYLVYLHQQTGVWQLSGKMGLNAQVIREYLGKAQFDQKFKLDAQGAFSEGKGESLGRLISEEPELFLANLRKNLRDFPAALSGMFPWYLLLAAGGGLLLYPWRRRQLLASLVIVSSCAPLVIYLLFFVQQRGFYPYVTALCVWAGGGFGLLGRLTGRRGAAAAARHWSPGVLLATLLAVLFVYQDLPHAKPPYSFQQDGGRLDDKHIGQRLRTMLPPSAVIMTRSARVAFYAQRPFVLPPQATLPEVLAYARQHRATHLVATMMLLSTRPQLEPLFGPILEPEKPFTPPPGLRIVFQAEEPGGLPYLVYEFTSLPNP